MRHNIQKSTAVLEEGLLDSASLFFHVRPPSDLNPPASSASSPWVSGPSLFPVVDSAPPAQRLARVGCSFIVLEGFFVRVSHCILEAQHWRRFAELEIIELVS